MIATLATVIAWTNASPDYATVAPLNLPATTFTAVPALAHVGALTPGDTVLIIEDAEQPYIIGKLA